MPTIDPVNDRKADELDQTNGWDSRHAIIRKRGRRPSDVDAEIAQDEWMAPPPAGTQDEPDNGDDE
jgi:capsid protein